MQMHPYSILHNPHVISYCYIVRVRTRTDGLTVSHGTVLFSSEVSRQ